jgi:hypothetical protein
LDGAGNDIVNEGSARLRIKPGLLKGGPEEDINCLTK